MKNYNVESIHQFSPKYAIIVVNYSVITGNVPGTDLIFVNLFL